MNLKRNFIIKKMSLNLRQGYENIEELNKLKIQNKKLEKENKELQREYQEIQKKNQELKTKINKFLDKLKVIFN